MPAHFRLPNGLQKVNWQICFDPFLNPLRSKFPIFVQTQTLIFGMLTESGTTKRPTCKSCSKPTSICLCNRLRTPTLYNSVAVTILQHSLEKKHPLNSTRIAAIGLKYVDVFTVYDVNFEAAFLVRLLGSTCSMGLVELNDNGSLFDEMPSKVKNDEFVGNSGSRVHNINLNGQIMERNGFNGAERPQICKSISSLTAKLGPKPGYEKGIMRSCKLDEPMLAENGGAAVINFTIEKYGKISSFSECRVALDKNQETSLDQLLSSDIADDHIRKGFIVKKLGRKMLEGSNEYEESAEFEIPVPAGSVLLFPSEKSVDVEAVNFEVKNLIVLDGTWAKAKRMYNENPWLSLLPHVRLALDKRSLYSEVRHQPRPGYMSTIESIIYAMKALGEDSEGLDGLLDVFESMVGDQRRCKNDRLRKASERERTYD